MTPRELVPWTGAALATAFGIAAAVACSITDDPRAGSRREGTSSSSSGGSSSGGIDAALPDTPLDCGPAPVSNEPFSKSALLSASAKCAAWHACTFLNAATALKKSVEDYANGGDRAAAQAAWRAAMEAWSRAELFQFGPVASKVADPYHGRGLRSFVHPWPDLNRCQAEGQIVDKGYEQGWDLVFPSARGLFGIEYVLFYEGADTACLPGSPTGQKWASLAPPDLRKAKDAYGVAVAGNVAAVALEIQNVWAADGESFDAKLLAFDGYGTDQEALNVVGWALLYVEKELKDFKLGSLAGVQATPPNPETPFAHVEIENIRANLRGFRALFQGCGEGGAGIGFDDWLVAANHAQLSNDILAALAAAEAKAATFPSFTTATQAQLLELYDAVRALSNLLKTNMFGSASPINLRLPAGVASDTD